MSEISNFRFWCQKVLPAVYDDSLSYYELLCKVVAKLNEVINSQNSTNDNASELAQQFEQLKNDLQGTVESEAEKVVDNYVKTNNLVKSINGITAVGETGAVTLQASDVGAIANVNDSVKENNIQDGAVTADKLAPNAVPVKSVNGKTGEVQITAEEVGALPNTAGSVGTSNLQDGAVGTDKIGDGAVTGDKLSDDAVPVKSVNTKTGEVVLSADDVGAITNTDGAVTTPKMADYSVTNAKIAKGTITPDRMADQGVENAGKLLKIGADGKPAWLSGEATVTAGVESVNGKDGVVNLNAEDVGAIANAPRSVKGVNVATYTRESTLQILKQRYPNASTDAPIRITGVPLLSTVFFDGAELKYAESDVVIFTEQMDLTYLGLPDEKALMLYNGILQSSPFVKTINGKSGAAVLTADDIDGALKEVAPSDMLTGQDVDGAYLFLAPAGGETDAFQKVDKLPENMIPNIDGSKIKNATIKSLQLAGGSVTADKIGLYAVTEKKINAGAVTEGKIADDSVSLSKMKAPGADFSGKVLGVSSAGQWELQTPSGGGEWEEIPATSLIEGATVHCRIQPGTGWLWFSITSNDDTEIVLAKAKSSDSSATTTNWGTINVNVCNKPVPPNGSSTSSDSYRVDNKNAVSIAGFITSTINDTSVSKLVVKNLTALTPSLTIKRNNTGVTMFGVLNTSSTIINGVHGDFFVPYWVDNRTTGGQ